MRPIEHIIPLLENNLRWFNQFNGIQEQPEDSSQEKEKSDTTTDQEIQLEILSKDIEDISIIKNVSGKSLDNGSFSRNSKSRYFFISAASSTDKSYNKLKDDYFMHSQLTSIYRDASCMQRVKELNSFLQDSLLEIDNLEHSTSFDFLNKSKIEDREMDITICRLKGDKLTFIQTGKTAYILIRWQSANELCILSRSNVEKCGVRHEVKVKDGDLVIMGLNVDFKDISDEEMKEIVKMAVKGKRCSANTIANKVKEHVKTNKKKFQCNEEATIITSWIAYNL